jgi:hypothetical protein
MEFDEGTYYLTVTPGEKNPLTAGLYNVYKSRPVGVIRPNVFSLVPLTISFRSITKVDKEMAFKNQRRIEMTLQTLLHQGIDSVRENLRQVVKWTDIVADGVFKSYEGSGFMKVEYGEGFRGVLEFVISELIRNTLAWEKVYGYSIDVKRADMDIMLLTSCPGDTVLKKFEQRLYDEKLKVSARQWDLGVSFRKTYLWKRPWGDIVQRIVEEPLFL